MRFALWIVVLVSGFVVPLFASSPCPASGKATLDRASALQFEQEWLEALQQKNSAALDCMLAGEFKDTSTKGELRPKQQVLRELPGKRPGDAYQQKLIELDAELFGDTAVIHGVNLISDQHGNGVLRIRFTDVLTFRNGRWLAVASQETSEQQ
jgi:hypothetical protein